MAAQGSAALENCAAAVYFILVGAVLMSLPGPPPHPGPSQQQLSFLTKVSRLVSSLSYCDYTPPPPNQVTAKLYLLFHTLLLLNNFHSNVTFKTLSHI